MKLAGRVKGLGSGLERVKTLLDQRSSTLGEAQAVLKVRLLFVYVFVCLCAFVKHLDLSHILCLYFTFTFNIFTLM